MYCWTKRRLTASARREIDASRCPSEKGGREPPVLKRETADQRFRTGRLAVVPCQRQQAALQRIMIRSIHDKTRYSPVH